MTGWTLAQAHAKLNLALVVGPARPDGRHEVVTVLQRVELADRVAIRPAGVVAVTGFAGDTLVRRGLELVAEQTGVCFEARIEKHIPVASGLGGGSADAGTTLRVANGLLPEPLPFDILHEIGASLGSDVPFFLRDGACVATGAGTTLRPVALPVDYHVLLVLGASDAKTSTGDVYADFDARGGHDGYESRHEVLERFLETVESPKDLARLPPNDLASSSLTAELLDLGAVRADVSGAGPTVYGIFEDEDVATRARAALAAVGRTWLTRPVP